MRILQRYFSNGAVKSRFDDERALWDISLYGISFQVVDYWNSPVPEKVFRELNREEMKICEFGRGATNIIDIGGQVGMVSVYMAKLFPNAKIHTYEAFDKNFEHLQRNIELNGIRNIVPVPLAVTGDGRDFEMICNTTGNTGGSTGCSDKLALGEANFTAKSTTLDSILDSVGSCDLLKIDCEGAEHEILKNARKLRSVKNLVGEFHDNAFLARQGYSARALEDYVGETVSGKIAIKCKRMCE